MENQQNSPLITKLDVGSFSPMRYLFYIVLGAIVLSQLVSAIIFLPGQLNQLSLNSQKMSELESQTAGFDSAVAVLEGLNETQVNSYLAKSIQALPNEKKVSGIVSSLTALASNSGVVVKELELTPCGISTRSAATKVVNNPNSLCENVKLDKDVSGIPLSMQVISDPSQLSDFVSQLQRVSPLLGIKSIDYNYGATANTSDVSLLLFFQPISQTKFSVRKISEINKNEENALNELSNQVVILP